MSAKDLISPYLNRFVDLNQQKFTAILELCCRDGKVTVNFHHDLGVIEEVTPKPHFVFPAYSDILKKNASTSQITRLQRRAETRAEEARAETKKQQNIAANARTEAEKAKADADSAIIEAEQARSTAEEAKEKLLKIQKDSEEMLSKLEQAEQARVLLEKHIEKAEKPIVFENKETDSDGDDECEHCHQEFQTKTS